MPKQDVAVEIFIDGAWVDLVDNDEVLADSLITINRGDTGDSSSVRPSSINLRLDNRSDKFRVSNPMSPFYGKAGVNTQLRVSVAGVVRGIGEISSWRCNQTRDFRATPRRGKAWTDIEANGIFYRINQWSRSIESTMVKGMLSFGDALIGAWPLEDVRETEVIGQITPGGYLGSFTGNVFFGDTERPKGSSSSVKMGEDGHLFGKFLPRSDNGYQVTFAFKLPAMPSSGTAEEIFRWTDSERRTWSWQVDNAGFEWVITDRNGDTVDTGNSSFGTDNEPTNWLRCKMQISVSGGTLTWEPAWYREGSETLAGVTNTFSSSIAGYPVDWHIYTSTFNLDAWYTAVFGIDNVTDNVFNGGVLADFNGRAGETAGDRFSRLFNDLGIANTANGTKALSMPMGGQNAEPLTDILREIRDTEDGILFDSKTSIRPVFTLRNFRFNQTPVVIDITDDQNGLPLLPTEVTDDLPVNNVVTAENRHGGSVTVQDTTSPMGTQDPPDGRGEYRQTKSVNVYNVETDLPREAEWWLAKGTINLPRFPQVTINLAAMTPAKIAELEDITIGTVLELQNYREYTIRLYVLAYVETIGTHSRSITYTCAPDVPYVTGIWDDADSHWDSTSHFVKTAVNPTATSITFRSLSSKVSWKTTGPYDVVIAGERITVTSVTASSLVSGGYDQVATVVRSVNGIFKSLDADEPIHVYSPGRWAF